LASFLAAVGRVDAFLVDRRADAGVLWRMKRRSRREAGTAKKIEGSRPAQEFRAPVIVANDVSSAPESSKGKHPQ
jgi:hypothetical protein